MPEPRFQNRHSESASVRLCGKRLHEMTPENTYIRPSSGQRSCRACMKAWREANAEQIKENQRLWRAAHPGYSTEYVRQYRSDPERRQLERERSLSWKERNRERNRARDREYARRRRQEAA